MARATVQVLLRLDPVLYERIKQLAASEQRSINMYVERILASNLLSDSYQNTSIQTASTQNTSKHASQGQFAAPAFPIPPKWGQ